MENNEDNAVIKALKEIVGDDSLSYISGSISNVGCDTCTVNEKTQFGSVYGFAIKIEKNEKKKEIFDYIVSIKRKNKCIIRVDEWKEIDDTRYFPLYWGKDKFLMVRVVAHLKSYIGTGTLQLNTLKKLNGYDIIFGAIECKNYERKESKIREKYPDILKTSTPLKNDKKAISKDSFITKNKLMSDED